MHKGKLLNVLDCKVYMVLSSERVKIGITALDTCGYSTFEIQQLIKLRYKSNLLYLPLKNQSCKLINDKCNYPAELTQRSRLYKCKRIFPCTKRIRKGMYYCTSHIQFAIDNNWLLEEDKETVLSSSFIGCCFELGNSPCKNVGKYECLWGTFCSEHTFLTMESIDALELDTDTRNALILILGLDKQGQGNSSKRRFLSRKHGIGVDSEYIEIPS